MLNNRCPGLNKLCVTSTNFSFLNFGEFFEIYVPLVKSFLNFVEVNSATQYVV